MDFDRLMHRVGICTLFREHKVFRTWYRTDGREWQLERPDVPVCEVRVEEYYLIDGVRYENTPGDREKAIEAAWLKFARPSLLKLITEQPARTKRQGKALKRLTFHRTVIA